MGRFNASPEHSRHAKVRSLSPKPSFEHIEDIECLFKAEKKVHDEGSNEMFCFLTKLMGLMALLLAFVAAIAFLLSNDLSPIDEVCYGHMVHYSPVTKQINTSPHHVVMNGGLNITSIYTGPPSAEVDAAWNHISYDMGVFSLPEDEARKAGLKEDGVRIPKGYEGAGRYMACLELTHQLQCLNFLRKAAWINYPYYKSKGTMEFNNTEDELERRLSYCVEILRQVLMCNADPGVIGYDFVGGKENTPFPDYSTPHKCRDWEGVLAYAYENRVPGHPEEQPLVPEKHGVV